MTRLAWALAVLGSAFAVAPIVPVAGATLPQQSGVVDLSSEANIRYNGVPSGQVGSSVAGACDVNGDGVDDEIVGAPYSAAHGNSSGSVFVVFGAAAPLSQVSLGALGTSGFEIDGGATNDRAGIVVACAGDTNADGKDDVLVAARNGSAYVVFGKATASSINLGASGPGGFRISGRNASVDPGPRSAAGLGDVNADGRADVIVGDWSTDSNGATDSGSAYVVFGAANTAEVNVTSLGQRGFRIDGEPGGGGISGSEAGFAVAGPGDLSGDGRPDILIGAPTACHLSCGTSAGRGQGAAYVVFTPASLNGITSIPLASAPGFRIDGSGAEHYLGHNAAGAGDVNGDGIPDVIVSDETISGFSSPAYVIFGGPSGLAINAGNLSNGYGYRISGAQVYQYDAPPVAGIGDFNGDGRDDVLVGAESDDAKAPDSGGAWVVYGKASSSNLDLGQLGVAGVRIEGAAPYDEAGFSVAGAGDVNADGRSDVLVGAHNAPGATDYAGRAYVVYGFGRPEFVYPLITGAVGTALQPVTPTVHRTGHATFAVTPPLPAGLHLDPPTGVISGTPNAPQPATAYLITMIDLAGTANATATIEIAKSVTPTPTPQPTPNPTPPQHPVTHSRPSKRVRIVTRGGLKLPPGYKRSRVCYGQVVVTLRRKARRLGSRTVRLNRRCRWRAIFRVRRSRLHGAKRLKFTWRFGGNRYLRSVKSIPRTVRVPASARSVRLDSGRGPPALPVGWP